MYWLQMRRFNFRRKSYHFNTVSVHSYFICCCFTIIWTGMGRKPHDMFLCTHAPAGVPRESKWSFTWLKVFKLCRLKFQWGNYLEYEKSKERRWKRNLIICWRLCLWWRKLPDGRIALGLTSLEVLNGGNVDFFWLKDAFTWITSGHRTRWFPKLRSTRVLIVDCFLSYA